MNILVVIPYYVPAYSYGGPVKVAHDLNKAFVKKGHNVTVITTDVHDSKSRNIIQQEEIDGVKIIRFRNFSNYLAKNFNAYLPFGFKKWIKENLKNYDIVHCHDFFTYQNIVISRYSKKLNIPFVLQPHGCLDLVRLKVKSSKLKAFFLRIFSSVLINAKHIITLTQHEKESIVSVCHSCKSENLQFKHNPFNFLNPFFSNKTKDPHLRKDDSKIYSYLFQKIKVIPNGINLKEFQNIQKIDLHKKYNLSPDTKLLFYFGRIQYIKGIDYILKTLHTLHYKLTTTNYQLFIIGPNEDGEKARLEKLIKKYQLEDKVTFTGQLEGGEKKQFLASCDLFLFLSRGEGLPMTILEIASLGIPSILSQECYVPEIAEGKGGYEVDKEKYVENAKLIVKHFQNESEIKEMQKNTQQVIKNQFELDVVVEKMLELYK